MTRSILALGVVVWSVAVAVGGWPGVFYPVIYALATLPGWPVGRRLFGSGHPAAWVSGAILGYGLTALALWVPVALGVASWISFMLAWVAVTGLVWRALKSPAGPLVVLPEWPRRAFVPFVLALLIVPVLVAAPYGRIGEIDADGNARYRAYFTADFVWHEALTAELARFEAPPRNPYLASRPLHYYWTYFMLPAVVAGTLDVGDPPAPIEAYLVVNGLLSAVLFVAAIFLAAWTAVPRAGPVAIATSLALLASSAEGTYATVDFLQRGVSLNALKALNIDAITYWYFQGLTIDGLPRTIWYTPQHAMSCSLGLVALMIAARSGRTMNVGGAAAAGLSLGLALMMSPFPAGAFTLVYAVAVLWDAATEPRSIGRMVGVQLVAAGIVTAALLWCVFNATFEGAGGAITFGWSSRALRRPFTIPALALGPILIPTFLGILAAARGKFPQRVRPGVVAVALAAALFYGVTLVLEPIWIGWRAGNIFLVTAPALVALGILELIARVGRTVTTVGVALLFAVGLPTTFIDYYNAQDTSNDARGPGFRWTVVLSPAEQEALRWLDTATPSDAVVQMSLEPRGRETWSLVPSFARRRMAAGLPISLLRTPEYDAPAGQADLMYATDDATHAWRLARGLGIDYVYVGRAERESFPSGVRFSSRSDLFPLIFENAEVAVYSVR